MARMTTRDFTEDWEDASINTKWNKLGKLKVKAIQLSGFSLLNLRAASSRIVSSCSPAISPCRVSRLRRGRLATHSWRTLAHDWDVEIKSLSHLLKDWLLGPGLPQRLTHSNYVLCQWSLGCSHLAYRPPTAGLWNPNTSHGSRRLAWGK